MNFCSFVIFEDDQVVSYTSPCTELPVDTSRPSDLVDFEFFLPGSGLDHFSLGNNREIVM